SYTQEVYERLQNVLNQDEDSLIAVLQAEWSRFGTFHNTAYHRFTLYTDLLKKGYLDSDESYLYTSKDNLRSLSDKNLKKWEKDHAAIMESDRLNAEKAGEIFLPDQPGYQPTLEYQKGAPELMIPEEISDD